MIGAMVVAGIVIIAGGLIFGEEVIGFLQNAMGNLEGSIPDITMPGAPEVNPPSGSGS